MLQSYGWQEKRLRDYLTKAGSELGQFRLVLIFNRNRVYRVTKEFKLDHYPGIYLLRGREVREGKEISKVYVGETDNLAQRLEDHVRNPPKEIKEWEEAIIITDGRTSEYSLLSDSTIRSYLEKAVINLLKRAGLCDVVNKVEKKPPLPVGLDVIGRHLEHELSFILEKMKLSTHVEDEILEPEDEIPNEELEDILKRKGYSCSLRKREGVITINGEQHRVFIRPGSLKKLGWQITLRDSELRNSLKEEKDYLLINRGKPFLVPLKCIKEWLGDRLETTEKGERAVTADIFVQVRNKRIVCPRVETPLDISQYQIQE